MAETYGFYDTEELVDGTYDREYIAQQWADYFKLFIGTGVFASPTNQLKVVAGEGMNIIVKEGWAFIEGRWYHNDADLVLPVQPNTTPSTITSGVFIQADSANREIKAVIATGRTTPDREEPHYELELAQLQIVTGTTAITDAMITDMRTDETVCGFVKGLLEGVIPTADLFLQFQSMFMTWFEHMKDQLSEDAAGHLQLEIEALQNQLGVFYDSVAEAEEDLDNIPDGTMIYTPDPTPDIQDEIDRLTTVHFIDSQVGAGSKNVTIYTASTKRLLVVTKKSGVVVGTKEIPTNVLESGDVVVLGEKAPVIYNDTTGTGASINGKRATILQTNGGESHAYTQLYSPDGIVSNSTSAKLASSAELSDGATLTFNGNNSFTLAVTDSTLSVYLYADMVVLGGSASAMNVAIDLTDTDMVSTNVEDAIKELHDTYVPQPDYGKGVLYKSEADIVNGATITIPYDCWADIRSGGGGDWIQYTINNSGTFQSAIGTHYPMYVRKGDIIKITSISATQSQTRKLYLIPFRK